ncbi:hypothetical protein [Actinophytocola gossypii]|uniref:Uncharacterized protein n=1 Tax=Actinophytocola gossypii TaxID=2812003 RepID=A0ABT2JGW1_9PSEU|nr:hypothetical protein [Actinophytocola gossypii]MCT2587123.1 hypothetical protein [Actinophytocola gossypii]
MRRRGRQQGPGRHRLGAPGLRHCLEYRAVAEALAEYRRNWWTTILVPTAKHSLAGLRRRAAAAAADRAWAPAIS